MKKVLLNGFLVAAICFGMSACDSGQQRTDAVETAEDANEEKFESSDANTATSAGASADDMEDNAEFAVQAASGGLFEVEAANLAMEKASGQEAKAVAKKILEDHTKANQELKALAAQKDITLPTAPSNEQQEKLTKLTGLSGQEFDEEYLEIMDAAHEKDIKLFEEASEEEGDPEIKAFAAKTLPTLRSHGQMIEEHESMAKGDDTDTLTLKKNN